MAHEGKVHVMGTVTAIHDKHIEVKEKSGKIKSILVTDKTLFQRENEKVNSSELKVGDRVVVHGTPDKKGNIVADEIHLGVAKKTEETKPTKPGSNPSKKGTHNR